MTSPDQKEHFHIKDDKKYDISHGRKNEEQICTLHHK
jgi:hypothetical protein